MSTTGQGVWFAMSSISQRKAIALFAAFAFAYFLSTLIRAITATLAPTLVQEFALNARDLGLLAGAYFLGFASIQLPLGSWLDRFGPKKVVLSFLTVAVVGCVAFSLASSFIGLVVSRMLCGAGVSACLMAPLTGYRRWYAPANQMRANSWMLMVGALGMVASTLPVQWLLPVFGWRPLFLGLGALVALAKGLMLWQILDGESGRIYAISSRHRAVLDQCGHASDVLAMGLGQSLAGKKKLHGGSIDRLRNAADLCRACYHCCSWRRFVYGRRSPIVALLYGQFGGRICAAGGRSGVSIRARGTGIVGL